MSTRRRGIVTPTLTRRNLLRTAGIGSGLAVAAGTVPFLRIAPSAAQDNVTLTFWLPGGSQTYCQMHNEVAADYSAANPNIAFEEIPCGTGGDFAQQLLAAIASGNPPDGTVLWDTPVSLAVRNALAPLDELMAVSTNAQAENWPAGMLASCQFDGATYGLPITAGVYGIWYNREWFEEKGIPSTRDQFPKTWGELRALSKEFTSWNGDRLETAGFIAPPLRHDPYTLPIWSALNGGQLYDAANQQYTIDAEANVAMMKFFLSWLDEEYEGDIANVERAAAWQAASDDEGRPPAFQGGKLAMTENGSWLMGDFYAYIEPVFEAWDVAPYPVGPGGSEAISGFWPNWIVIPAGSDNVEEMFAYFDYMSVEGVQKWFTAVPDMPTNTKVPEVVPQIAIEKRGEEFAAEIMTFFREQAAVTTPMWDSPIQSFANDQLTVALERIATKQSSPQDALAEAQQACQAELGKVLQG